MHLTKMTNLCFIFFFKISLEHILLSQDCLKCCQRPNNQWHMQLKSWLIFNNHTSRQLNYSHKEQKNQLPTMPRLLCKKSTTLMHNHLWGWYRNRTIRQMMSNTQLSMTYLCNWSHGWYSTVSQVNILTTVTKNGEVNSPRHIDWVGKGAQP